MLDGRVKTLHPRIHAGILAVRSNERAHGRPAQRTASRRSTSWWSTCTRSSRRSAVDGVALDEAVEMIDIGGPTMVRAAAKNYARRRRRRRSRRLRGAARRAAPRSGALSDETRLRLAAKAFRTRAPTTPRSTPTSAAESRHARRATAAFPDRLLLDLRKVTGPALRRESAPARRVLPRRRARGPEPRRGAPAPGQGAVVQQLPRLRCRPRARRRARRPRPARSSSTATRAARRWARSRATAFERALECDPMSAFGGVIAFNRQRRPAARRTA